MKRAFISVLLFYLTFHFIIPGIYFLCGGNFNLYSNIEDYPSVILGFSLNALTVLGSILVISFIPTPKAPIKPAFYSLNKFFYFTLGITIYFYFLRGGYEGTATGNLAGSFLSYATLFFKTSLVVMAMMFYQKRKINVVWLLLIFVASMTLTGSRSGIVVIFLFFLLFPMYSNYRLYKRKVIRTFLIFAIASPVLFIFATVVIRNTEDFEISPKLVADQIAGRISFLETSMLPIHFKNETNEDLEIFYRKYSPINQFKLALDALIPGQLFEPDVFPNQYYRAAFLGATEDFSRDVYNSINITLPVFLYMYLGGPMSVLIGILIISAYYMICRLAYRVPWIFVPMMFNLYFFLMFFDFPMWFYDVSTGMIAMLIIQYYSMVRNYIVQNRKASKPTGLTLPSIN